MPKGKLLVQRFGEPEPNNAVPGASSRSHQGLPDHVSKLESPHTPYPSAGRCCTEMNEAISHCVQVTDLPESVTSIRDKEITLPPSVLPHSALSSPTLISEGQLLLAEEKKGKTNREGIGQMTQF